MTQHRTRSHLGQGQQQATEGLVLAGGFAFAVGFFWWLGRLMEGWIGLSPWIQITGLVVGWILGFMHVYYWTKDKK